MSHISLTYHIVFGTYARERTIPPEYERSLYTIIYNLAKSKGVMIRRIGGMSDHVHILCDIPPVVTVAEVVKTIKSESSKFLRNSKDFPRWRGWGEGYGAFSVSASLRDKVCNYIIRQNIHHSQISFEEEYKAFLESVGLE